MSRTLPILTKTVHTASQLPWAWDELCSDYFQTREFLLHTEKFNPCGQSYRIMERGEILMAGVVLYTLKLNLLTFLRLPSPLKMKIAGIPCSVSAGGFIGKPVYADMLAREVKQREKGLLLALNRTTPDPDPRGTTGFTLPAMVIPNRFTSWREYKKSLRSSYRRRLQKQEELFREVTITRKPCRDFTPEMYKLYRAVLEKSRDKLETLSCNFFRHLPEGFNLFICCAREGIIGWNITLNHKKRFSFFLGGIDYRYNAKYSTYFNMLREIVRQGIDSGAVEIDLGQTAEQPKALLGARYETRYMTGSHSVKPFNQLIKKFKNILTYNKKPEKYKVFKEES